jgi:hypothetical protein
MTNLFIKTRFTHTPDEPYWFTDSMEFIHMHILDEFITQYGKIIHKTYGEEEASRKHVHIHYEVDTSKSKKKNPKVIHQTFLYYLKSIKGLKDKPPKKSSSITINVTEKEPGRILQYPLKQDNLHFHLCQGYTKAELNLLHGRASAEYRLEVKKQQTLQAKKDKESETWNALCKWCDDDLKNWSTDKTVLDDPEIVKNVTLSMYRYYMKHKQCQISRTIQDKAIRYLMSRGIMTPQDIYYFYYERNKY